MASFSSMRVEEGTAISKAFCRCRSTSQRQGHHFGNSELVKLICRYGYRRICVGMKNY